nr:ribonuclease HII [uncultured Anaerostipes sp.]
MIKLHISNIDSFFETVNECNGSVNVIDANGNSTNIAHQIFEQRKLYKAYYQNKKCLDLCLNIPNPSDYFKIVSYYAGDC